VLSREQNDLLTQTGPGTPGGDLMRRYWQPVALAEEMTQGAPPKPIRVFGEDLVLFRSKRGDLGLMALHCPHRGADLSFGRVEDAGLRCIYHGWLIDTKGRCLEMPTNPPDSPARERVRHTAYPCREAAGMIVAYLGPGEAPPLPPLPIFTAPPERVWSYKLLQECNYLQGNEGNVDPQHLSFLHRMAAPNQAPDERAAETDALLGADVTPRIEVEETGYGLRLYAIRAVGDNRKYVRVTNFIMPNTSAFDGGPVLDPARARPKANLGYQMHWHVPIDDGNHWKFVIAHRHDGPIDVEYLDRTIGRGAVDEPYNARRRSTNRYLQDRAEMGRRTFLGMGFSFQDHDRFATESQGPISDRTREHLGASDRGVVAMRRQMLNAIEEMRAGREPLLSARAVNANPLAELCVVTEIVPTDHDPRMVWRDFLAGLQDALAGE
jgi:phthalate 4,5-dioxygenase